MATVTRERRSSKSKPFTCSFVSITIEIQDTRYSVDEIPAGECGTRAYRLCKHSGDHEVYDLVRTHAGIVECSCPDHEARHRGNGFGMCKHGKALVTLGLMPEPCGVLDPITPAPVVETPAPAPCCEPSEPAPCVACEPPASAVDLPGEMADAGDAESDPELWGDEWDDHIWNLGPDAPDGEPTDEDRAEAAEFFGEMEARSFLDASERLTLAELVDKQCAFIPDGATTRAGCWRPT